MMPEFGDLIRSHSFRSQQKHGHGRRRKVSAGSAAAASSTGFGVRRRGSSSSQSSSPDRSKVSAGAISPIHCQPLGMFLIVPAVGHARSNLVGLGETAAGSVKLI